MILILVGIALLFVIYYTLVRPFNYWKNKGVIQHSVWRTWLEIFLSIIQYQNIAEGIQKIYDEFPDTRYYGIYNFFTPTLAIKDPELIKQIVVKDFDHFVDHLNFVPHEESPLWQKNLFILKGDEWRDMRTALGPSFTSSKMKIMFELISDCAKQFVDYFQNQNLGTIDVEMKDIFTRFTNDVIATSAFGVTCDSMRNKENEFYRMGKKAAQFGGGLWESLQFFAVMLLPKLSKLIGLQFIKKDVSEFFMNLIKTNIQTREENGIVRPDMVHILLEARKNRNKNEKALSDAKSDPKNEHQIQKSQITDEEIAAQAFIFFIAGFDSVATLMYFMAYELALQPDIQQQLQSEIDNIRNERGNSITYEDLTTLKYMDMVISETLRKWPNAIILDRLCVKPYTIQPTKKGEKPIHLTKGDLIWFPIFGIHRDSENYPEPNRFDPERFSEENKNKINPYVNMPFGAGPRVCIGNRFALMETKLVFFYLLSAFELTVTGKTPIPLVLDRSLFQLNCAKGFWLGLKARKQVA